MDEAGGRQAVEEAPAVAAKKGKPKKEAVVPAALKEKEKEQKEKERKEAEEKAKGSREIRLQAVADRFYRGDIADALERYIKDPGLRQRAGQAGREKVVGEFDLTKNAARLAEYFLKDRQ